MLNNKVKRKISLILTVSIISSISLGSTVVKAASKSEFPSGNTIIAGDIIMPYSPANGFKIVNEAVSHGYAGDDLNIIYVRGGGKNGRYYNFTEKFGFNPANTEGSMGTASELTQIWSRVKYTYDGKFEKFDNIVASSDAKIKVKSAFGNLISITDTEITIPSNTTKSIFESMIESSDGTNATQTFTYNPDPATGAITDGTSLTVTAEDDITKYNYTFKVSAGEGSGSIDLSVEQLKSVLKTQIAGAEALLSTVPDEKKTEFEKAIKTAEEFYKNITSTTTIEQITKAIGDLADAVTEAFNKESYFDVTYNFDNIMGTVQAVYKGTSTAIPNGARVANNSEVTFTAAPKTGYEVKSWTVNGIKDAVNVTSKDVTITKDTTVSVEFGSKSGSDEKTYYSVTYDFDNTQGTLEAVYKDTSTAIPSGSKVAKDSQVTFTATPKDNTIEVKSWTVNGTTETVKNTSKDVTVTGNTNVFVTFGSKSDVDEFTVTFDDKYSVNNKVYATVTSAVYTGNDFEPINSGDTVAKGAKIRFSVNVKDDNYAFTNWNITNNGADSTDSNETTEPITVNGNVTAKANFKDASSGTEKTKASVSFENNSVSSTVYNGTVSNTTYNVYAQLSATQVDFNISNNKASVEFAIGAKVGSSDASADQLSKLISNLSFAINSDSTNYVESAKIENGKLVVVLKTDKIESDNISTITLNTSFNNSTAGTTNLKFKVTLK